MSKEMICPICGCEIEYNDGYSTYDCKNNPANHNASEEIWQALIQAKQDLEIAVDALNAIIATPLNSRVIHDAANRALKQIEHKE